MSTGKTPFSIKVLFGTMVVCLFSYKLTVISVGESGIRVDDFLILIALFVLLFRGDLLGTRLSRAFKLYSLFIVVNLASTIWNSLIGRINPIISLFFDVRLIEYMVFYFLGYSLRKAGKSLTWPFVTYTLLMMVVIPLQSVGIIPAVNNFASSRASGNTNGPYEFAAVAGFLLCYLGYEKRKVIYGGMSLFFLVLSASRSTTLGVVISLFRVLARFARRSIGSAALAVVSAIVGVSLLVGVFIFSKSDANGDITGRITSASSSLTWDEVVSIYATAPIADNYLEYWNGVFEHRCDNGACNEENGDPSTLYRLYAWATLIKSTNAHFSAILLGFGPSMGTEAVDGYYVRLYIETGLIGCIVFFFAISSFWQSGRGNFWPFQEYLIILLFSGIFIDIFSSYRPMILMWLWHGTNQYDSEASALMLAESADTVEAF